MDILIHATLYPEGETSKRANTTLFMHYYAAEWVKAGHRVLVAHHKTAFPRWMSRAGAAVCGKLPGMKRVRDYLNGYGLDPDCEFERDGVQIVRRSMNKLVPRTLYSRFAIRRRARLVAELLRERDFHPALVLCEFTNPGLYVALAMRETLSCPVAAVLHNTDMEYFARGLTSRRALDAAYQADALAFRTDAAADAFANRYFAPKKRVVMMSGVPARLATPEAEFRPRERVREFLCVCRQVPTKHAEAVIEAFGETDAFDARLTLIGEGVAHEALVRLAERQRNADRIRFLAPMPREDVFREMARADCFVLVSELETFGMAYVEAMSTGCIPVASSGEGASAFLRDGQNGFLTPAGDAQTLAALMKNLLALPKADAQALSRAAYAFARPLRDDELARRALEELLT